MKKPYESAFGYRRRVAYADTDAMGVVHHVNYLRYFEEARVAWLRERGLIESHYPRSENTLAVLESICRHLRPARFEDELIVHLQIRREGLKIHMQYAIVLAENPDDLVALGSSILVPLNKALKPIKLPEAYIAQLEKEIWTETWL